MKHTRPLILFAVVAIAGGLVGFSLQLASAAARWPADGGESVAASLPASSTSADDRDLGISARPDQFNSDKPLSNSAMMPGFFEKIGVDESPRQPYLRTMTDAAAETTAPRRLPASLNAPQSVQPGFTIDLAHDAVLGQINAGDTVVVMVGTAYGAAVADGSGFFWTPIWQASGSPLDLVGGETLEISVNGALVDTVTPAAISGGISVLDDEVTGTLNGLADGVAVTATVGGWGQLPSPGAPFVSGLTDPSGGFTLAFDDVDLTAGNLAQVEYQASAQTYVRNYLRSTPAGFVIVNGNRVQGYANPYQHILVTVYSTYPTDIIWQIEADADQNGYYDVLGDWVPVAIGSVFEVIVDGSSTMVSTLADLHDITFAADLDQVSGTAPADEDVLVFFSAWQDDHVVYTQTKVTADSGGAFSANFGSDLLPRSDVGVFVHDDDGSSTAIFGGAPYIEAQLVDGADCFVGRADAPNQPMNYSLQTPGGIYTRTASTLLTGMGNEFLPSGLCYSIRGDTWPAMPFEPGDILMAQAPSWSGSLTIPALAWQPDTAADLITGEAPDGDLRVDVIRWIGESYPDVWMSTRLTTASGGTFGADFSSFNLRDADRVSFRYYEPVNGFGTQWMEQDVHFFNVYAPWGVYGRVNTPNEFITADLYEADGTWVAGSSITANQSDFWIGEFQSQVFSTGRWITITGSSGWVAGLQIPELSVDADEQADLIWGQGPTDLLNLATNWHDQLFIPSLGDLADPSFLLDTTAYGYDLQWGDNTEVFYTALNGDRFWHNKRWPQIIAHYGLYTNDDHVYGYNAEAFASVLVTVTAPGGSVVGAVTLDTNVFGDYDTRDLPDGAITPGNTVWVDYGLLGVHSLEVLPITGEANPDTEIVTLTAPPGTPINLNANGPSGGWDSGMSYGGAVVGDSGVITFDLSVDGYDVALGTIFEATANQYHNHQTRFTFWLPVLNIRTNYGHDWVEGNFEAGHTLWLTVTNSSGEVKATASGVTGLIPWWGDQEGFSTNHNITWDGPQPDIQAGDWVYASLDTGLSTESQLGVIDAVADVAADVVAGTIDAPWYTDPLHGDCGIWEDNGPGVGFDFDPNGGSFTCDFSSQWDIIPGQMVGVSYNEPDGDQVINMTVNPAPNLRIWSWLPGALASGGNASFSVAYRNDGDGPTENATISATLQGGLTYLGDTSNLPVSGVGTPDDPLVWQLGTLPADQQDRNFYIFAAVTAAPGDWVTLTTQIENGTPYDQDDWGAKFNELVVPVSENDTHLDINKDTWTWDPAPGTEFVYRMQACNNGSTASTDLIMTDTLPLSTTLVTWWGEHAGWDEVISSTHELVVTRPSVAGYQCYPVYIQVALDADAWVGMQLHNQAWLYASNDLESEDDFSEIWHNVGAPHANLSVQKNWNWGSLTPGGEIRYNVNYQNSGNIPVANVRLTDTLPANTTFVAAYWYDDAGSHLLPPDVNADGVVAWNVGTLMAGFNRSFEIALQIDEDAVPGTELVNTAEITRLPIEDRVDDNTSSVVEMLYDHGPNLRVRVDGNWHGYGEGHNAWYHLVVENVGDVRIDYATITDTLPSAMLLDGDPDTDWGSVENYIRNDAEGWFSFTFRDLHPNWRRDVNINVVNPDPDPIPGGLFFTDYAEFEQLAGEPTYADNASEYTLSSGPDLYVEKTLVAGDVLPGEIVTYSLLFGNEQMGYTWWWNLQGNAWLTDTLPAGAEFISAVQRWCGDTFWCPVEPMVQDDQLTWQLWPMGGEQWNEFYVTVRLPDTLTGQDTVVNQAEIASDQPQIDIEADYSNNLVVSAIPVMLPYFDVEKTYAGNGVAGTIITYTVYVENMGNAVASDVVLNDQLPGGLTYLGGGDLTNDIVAWTIEDEIAPQGGMASGQFWGELSCSAGTIVNNQHYQVVSSAQGITSTEGAPVSFNILAPTIAVDATASASEIQPGATVAFTATATTDGTLLTYSWDFGSGNLVTGATAEFTFAVAGTYDVTVTVTDGCGFTATDTIQVVVSSGKIYLPLIQRRPTP